MIQITPAQEVVLTFIISHEGLSAYVIARDARLPPWRVQQALSALQRAGILIEDANTRQKPQDATYWYVHPDYRAAFELPPLELNISMMSDYLHGPEERQRIMSDLLREQKEKKKTIRYQPVECKHCGQRHCVPPKGRKRYPPGQGPKGPKTI